MRPSSIRSKERKTTPQAMATSTGERKRKSEGREYETPLPLPCRPKELDVLLDKWIANGIFKPDQVSREPTEEERRDSRFYLLYNYVQHLIAKCLALRRLVHWRIKEGTLEVQRNSLPNRKGKGAVAVVICADPREDEEERPALPATTIATLQKSSRFKNLFDQLELIVNEQRIARRP